MAVFIAFVYNCIIPFIYATELDPVKVILLHMIFCKNISQEVIENVAAATTAGSLLLPDVVVKC